MGKQVILTCDGVGCTVNIILKDGEETPCVSNFVLRLHDASERSERAPALVWSGYLCTACQKGIADKLRKKVEDICG